MFGLVRTGSTAPSAVARLPGGTARSVPTAQGS